VLQVLDTTLREGEQTPGVYFDGHIKLAIARLLDQIGIDIIEAGHPVVSPEIHSAVRQIAALGLRSVIGAHSRSLEQDVDLALESDIGFLGIFYCVSDDRLNHVFRRDLKSAVDQISRIIAYARKKRPSLLIRYTPEDTVRSSFQNVVDASRAAVEAGADIISIADTTGYMIPGTERSMYDYVSRFREQMEALGLKPRIAVHCHNDRGQALCNALDAFRAGAEIIDASVMGLGERAGIVDLAQLLVILQTDFQQDRIWRMEKLPELYALVSKYSGVPIPRHFPVTGQNAFTHCAGVHTHAAIINPLHYQSLDPAVVGRKMTLSLDHMSGLASVEWALEQIGMNFDRDLAMEVLTIIKDIGHKGRVVDLEELGHIVDWCRKNEPDKAYTNV
jgi:2-isopropylmalate synthase